MKRGDKREFEVKGLVTTRTVSELEPVAPHIEIWCKWSCTIPSLNLRDELAITKTRWLRKFDTSKYVRSEIDAALRHRFLRCSDFSARQAPCRPILSLPHRPVIDRSAFRRRQHRQHRRRLQLRIGGGRRRRLGHLENGGGHRVVAPGLDDPFGMHARLVAEDQGGAGTDEAAMQTRSRKVEMPSGLSLPLVFGMYTLLMGSGR